MRRSLLVSEWIISRAKLCAVLLQLVVVLADGARSANTLWLTARQVELGGRRIHRLELDQMDFIAFGSFRWSIRQDPQWMYF